jgi:hypothetical protein
MRHLKMLTIAAVVVAFAGAAAAQSSQPNANQPVGPQGVSANNANCACECNAGMSDGTGNKQVGAISGTAYGPGDGSGTCDQTPLGSGDCTGVPTADCICLCDGSGGGAGNGTRNGSGNGQKGTGDCEGPGIPGTGTCPNP